LKKIRDDYTPSGKVIRVDETYSDTTETGKVIIFRNPILSSSDSVFFNLKQNPISVDPNKAQPIVPGSPKGGKAGTKPSEGAIVPSQGSKNSNKQTSTNEEDTAQPAETPKKEENTSPTPDR